MTIGSARVPKNEIMHGISTDYLEHPFEFFANIKAKSYEDVQLVIKKGAFLGGEFATTNHNQSQSRYDYSLQCEECNQYVPKYN